MKVDIFDLVQELTSDILALTSLDDWTEGELENAVEDIVQNWIDDSKISLGS